MKRARFAPLAAGLALAGCMVGPDYVPPPVLAPESFKELKGNLVKGWKLAAPRDRVDAGPWWAVYNDPTLDALEAQVEISNQTVVAAVEAYEQARTLVREAEAALFPTINAGYSTLAPIYRQGPCRRLRARARRRARDQHDHHLGSRPDGRDLYGAGKPDLGTRHLGQDPPTDREQRRRRAGKRG